MCYAARGVIYFCKGTLQFAAYLTIVITMMIARLKDDPLLTKSELSKVSVASSSSENPLPQVKVRCRGKDCIRRAALAITANVVLISTFIRKP